MDDIRREFESKCRKIFEDFADSQGLIFEETYDSFYETAGWVIRFANKSTGKHWEHIFLMYPNSIFPDDNEIPSLCWTYIEEAIKFLY